MSGLQQAKEWAVEKLESILNSPAGKALEAQAIADEEKRRLAERAQKRAEFDTLAAASDAAFRAAQKEIAELEATEQRHTDALACARAETNVVRSRISLAEYERRARRDRLLAELSWTASPTIADFITELRDLMASSNQNLDEVQERTIHGDMHVVWTNRASIQQWVVAARLALAAAEELKCEHLDESAVVTRLAALRASLPKIDTRHEHSSDFAWLPTNPFARRH